MPTALMPVTARPLPKAPAGANMSDVWRDKSGLLQKHDIQLPVDPDTYEINGRLFACVVSDCPTAELVIAPKTEPKMKHCPADGQLLAFVPLDDTQGDPIAVGRQRQLAWLAQRWAAKKEQYATRIRESAARQAVLQTRQAAPQRLAELATDMQGHVPSLAAVAAVEIGVLYTVDLTNALETAAIASAVIVCGAVAGYLLAVQVEKIRLRLRKEGFEGRAARKARDRGLWVVRGAASTGALLAAAGLVEALGGGLAQADPWLWGLLSLIGLGLAWWTNAAHWNRLWAQRKRLRQLAADNARRAAEEEARRAMEEAARAMEEARLREQLAEVGAIDEDNPLHQGQRMKIEWEKVGRLPTAATGFLQINQTTIVPEQTREITVPDPHTGKRVRIGWEFLGQCDPGALVSRGGPVPPILMAKEWLVSVLFEGRYDAGSISLIDRPDGRQNTFLVMITERARLGDAVTWRADRAVRVEPDGTRYGYLGGALTGEDLDEVLYRPGQPFGGLVTGTTGGGKGQFAIRYLLNCLLAGILPVLFDPKGLVDYGDFAGLFPIGWTKRHRRIILESLAAERQRREGVLATAPKTNRHGARVAGESKWNTHDPVTGEIGIYGEPIASVWDEFHDLVKDPAFVQQFTNHVRFQRASAEGALLLSQGGGLTDWGDSLLRDLGSQTSLTQFRSGDLHSRLAGGRNQVYSTADLPMLPGMCLRQAVGSPEVPLRAAYITRDPEAEDTVYTTLWGKGVEPQMQVPDPMDWISDETKALWEETGLMELWRLAQGPGGLDRLRADTREDEEDETSPAATAQAAALVRPAPAGMGPARMPVRDVLLAILHLEPGVDGKGIEASEVWMRAPGWAGSANRSQITRAARTLDPTIGGTQSLPQGVIQKVDRGPGSTCWRLTPEGRADGARAAAMLRPLGGAETVVVAPATGRVSAVALAEMVAQQAAETRMVIAEETRRAQSR